MWWHKGLHASESHICHARIPKGPDAIVGMRQHQLAAEDLLLARACLKRHGKPRHVRTRRDHLAAVVPAALGAGITPFLSTEIPAIEHAAAYVLGKFGSWAKTTLIHTAIEELVAAVPEFPLKKLISSPRPPPQTPLPIPRHRGDRDRLSYRWRLLCLVVPTHTCLGSVLSYQTACY